MVSSQGYRVHGFESMGYLVLKVHGTWYIVSRVQCTGYIVSHYLSCKLLCNTQVCLLRLTG